MTGALIPAAVAVLCVLLVIFLRVRARRGTLPGSRDPGKALMFRACRSVGVGVTR